MVDDTFSRMQIKTSSDTLTQDEMPLLEIKTARTAAYVESATKISAVRAVLIVLMPDTNTALAMQITTDCTTVLCTR